MEVYMNLIIFLIGIFFGSFFTLAVHRIPLKENITYKHSYCPKCNHKLGILDLIPIFSYIGLKGRCRYCKEKVRIRYLLLEILAGITFLLYAISLNINWEILNIQKIVYLVIGLLYFSSLFIIAGIDKEKVTIQKSVIIFGLFVELIYMIYVCTLQNSNVYGYVIYLTAMILIIILDTFIIKKTLDSNYTLQILLLITYMGVFSGAILTGLTIVFALILIMVISLIKKIKEKTNHSKLKDNINTNKIPFGFYLIISNITLIILANFYLVGNFLEISII